MTFAREHFLIGRAGEAVDFLQAIVARRRPGPDGFVTLARVNCSAMEGLDM